MILYRHQHQQLRSEDAQKHSERIHGGITHIGQLAALWSHGVGKCQSGIVGGSQSSNFFSRKGNPVVVANAPVTSFDW